MKYNSTKLSIVEKELDNELTRLNRKIVSLMGLYNEAERVFQMYIVDEITTYLKANNTKKIPNELLRLLKRESYQDIWELYNG